MNTNRFPIFLVKRSIYSLLRSTTISSIRLPSLLLDYREAGMGREVKLRRQFRVLFVTVRQQIHHDKVDLGYFQNVGHLLSEGEKHEDD